MGKEDQELVRTAQSGAEPEAQRAFAELLVRWKDPIHAWILPRIRDPQAAEEATFDTFVEAWRHLPELRDPGAFRPWLYRLARTRVSRRYEARGMSFQVTPIDQGLLEEQEALPPLEAREEYREALGKMDPEDLRLLNLKYDEHLTYAEIAGRLGVSVSTVRDRLVATRARLTRELERFGVFKDFAKGRSPARPGRPGAAAPDGGAHG